MLRRSSRKSVKLFDAAALEREQSGDSDEGMSSHSLDEENAPHRGPRVLDSILSITKYQEQQTQRFQPFMLSPLPSAPVQSSNLEVGPCSNVSNGCKIRRSLHWSLM